MLTNADFIKLTHSDAPQGAQRLIRHSTIADLRSKDRHYPIASPEHATYLKLDEHNYLSNASFYPVEGGKAAAVRSAFAALHCVTLHKIPRVHRPEFGPFFEPTWIFEVDRDTYDVGIVFDKPITDFTKAKAVLKNVAEAYPGHVRSFGSYHRLPQGSAHGPQPKVVAWNPTARVDLELLTGYVRLRVERHVRTEPSSSGIDELKAMAQGHITLDDMRRALRTTDPEDKTGEL